MKLRLSDVAKEDLQYWRRTDVEIWKLVKALIKHTQREPYKGLGRPKALTDDLKGYWSRRITAKDRFVYRVRREGRKEFLEILMCRGHYK